MRNTKAQRATRSCALGCGRGRSPAAAQHGARWHDGGMTERDFRTLPEPVHVEDTVASLESEPPQDPEGDRNKDLRRALHDD